MRSPPMVKNTPCQARKREKRRTLPHLAARSHRICCAVLRKSTTTLPQTIAPRRSPQLLKCPPVKPGVTSRRPGRKVSLMATIEKYETESGATLYRVRYRTPDKGQRTRADSARSGTPRTSPTMSRSRWQPVTTSRLKLGKVTVDELSVDWLARKKQVTAERRLRHTGNRVRRACETSLGIGGRGRR